MANRLDTFRALRDTYVTEIGALYDKERQEQAEIEALEAQLAVVRARLKNTQAERETTVTQLKGIRTVIRAMEDRNTIDTRRREDNTIQSAREIEDREYGEI